MRISFLGKGGSGKTTTAAGFIQYLSNQNHHVLAIDADMNVHLQDALGIVGKAVNLSDNFGEIKNYINANRDLKTNFIGSTPPTHTSQFIKPKYDNPFIQKYALQQGNVALLTVGSYNIEDLGITCYHGKLGSLQAVMHHLVDTKNDWVVADTTAGVDNLGTSLFFAYDLNIFVVEPTIKSVQVFQDFLKFAQDKNIKVMCIINKYEQGDKEFIETNIDSRYIIGKIYKYNNMKKVEQGDKSKFTEFVKINSEVYDQIVKTTNTITRDWDQYQSNLNTMHTKSSKEWYNDYYHQDLLTQIDPNFKYSDIK